jgi:hypothetical protein
MKRLLLILCAMAFVMATYSQDLQSPPLFFPDSLKKVLPAGVETMPALPAFGSDLPFRLLYDPIPINAPAFNIDQYLKNRRNITYYSSTQENLSPGQVFRDGFFSGGLPFAHSGAVFHQTVYQLNDKINVGGNSFGAKSIFSAPLPLNGQNQWDVRGASMFMQYKVNKNFKIETRVSVMGNQYYP